MPVICQLCQKSFEKLVSSTHLRHIHNITSQDYKSQFGPDSLSSPEYRQERSEKNSGANDPMFGKQHTDQAKAKTSKKLQGRLAHNKGKKVTDSDVLLKIQDGIKKREQRYREENYHPRKNAKLSQTTRDKISQSVITYAKQNAEELKQRAQQAQATLRNRGYDFGSKMRGRHHSVESRQKISRSSKIRAQFKRSHARILHSERAAQANITVLGYTGNIVGLQCNHCNNLFDMTVPYLTESKFRADLCPYCRKSVSKSRQELEVLDFIRSKLQQPVLSGNRNQIWPLELDIFIPHLNLAIEYCGLYWHSELQGKGREYHKHKLKACKEKNIKLITIFEDEWLNKKSIVESRLLSQIGCIDAKIPARKCRVEQILPAIARKFCAENHIQGQGSCRLAYGLYHQDVLVSVMTFSRPNISKGQKNQSNKWELNRFCSLQMHQVQGAASKLFAAFIKDHDPQYVYTYADMRWSEGGLYQKLGFTWVHDSPPNYWYIFNGQIQRLHRFNLRKNCNDNPQLTEWQNRQQQGYNRIWDCGNSKWEWTKKPGI